MIPKLESVVEGVAADLITVVQPVTETVGEGEEIGAGLARIVALANAAIAKNVLVIACKRMTVKGICTIIN